MSQQKRDMPVSVKESSVLEGKLAELVIAAENNRNLIERIETVLIANKPTSDQEDLAGSVGQMSTIDSKITVVCECICMNNDRMVKLLENLARVLGKERVIG